MQCQRRTDTSFGCPLVGRRDLERRQAMHRERVSRIGSSIDTRPPAAMPHLTLYGRDYAAKKRATTEAAFSDLKMIQTIAKTMTRKVEIPMRKGPISLNADTRKMEIFRIMKENHRLLDRLENLEPIVSTTDLVQDYKHKQRYTILTSHSKRLAGEYDHEVNRIKMEDKVQTDAMNRSVQARLARHRMKQSSMSAPSLTPLAATDPGPSMVSASPSSSTKQRKRVEEQPKSAPEKPPKKVGNLPKEQPKSVPEEQPKSVPQEQPTEQPKSVPGELVVEKEAEDLPVESNQVELPPSTKVLDKQHSKVSFVGTDDDRRASLGSYSTTPHHKKAPPTFEEDEEDVAKETPPLPSEQVDPVGLETKPSPSEQVDPVGLETPPPPSAQVDPPPSEHVDPVVLETPPPPSEQVDPVGLETPLLPSEQVGTVGLMGTEQLTTGITETTEVRASPRGQLSVRSRTAVFSPTEETEPIAKDENVQPPVDVIDVPKSVEEDRKQDDEEYGDDTFEDLDDTLNTTNMSKLPKDDSDDFESSKDT